MFESMRLLVSLCDCNNVTGHVSKLVCLIVRKTFQSVAACVLQSNYAHVCVYV